MRKINSLRGWSLAAAIFVFTLELPFASADLNPLKSLMKDGGGISKSVEVNADASTGTVTTVAPGKEKEPVTCNEIMAQAVVIASEEKEAAIHERDEALTQAARAIERADELSAMIDGALAEAKNATIEYEAVKLMSERLVEDAKKEGEARVQAVQKKLDTEKNELTDLFLEQKQQLHDDFERAKVEMEEEAQGKIEEAMLKLKTAEEKAKQQVDKVNSEMESLRQTSAYEIKTVKEQAATEIQTVREKTTAEVDDIKKDSATNIKKVQTEIETLSEVTAAEKNKLQKEADDLLELTKKEMTEHLELVRVDLLKMVTDAEERAARIERDAENKVEETMKMADALVVDTQRAATMANKKVQQEASENLEKHEKMFMERYETLESEFFDYRKKATKNAEKLQATIDLREASIIEYKKNLADEEQKFQLKSEEMQYWKTIHDQQGYVNTTLVMIDSKAFIDKTIVSIEKSVIDVVHEEVTVRSKVLLSQIVAISQPYQAKMKDLYHEHLEATVDESIMPFYFKHVIPLTVKAEKKLSPLIEKIGRESEIQYLKAEAFVDASFNSLCTAVKGKAIVIKRALVEGGRMPDFVISSLEVVENDTAASVILSFKIIAAFLTFALRSLIISTIVWVLMLPFRVIWYFCPLRLIIGDGKRKVKKAVASEMAADAKKRSKKKRPKVEDQ